MINWNDPRHNNGNYPPNLMPNSFVPDGANCPNRYAAPPLWNSAAPVSRTPEWAKGTGKAPPDGRELPEHYWMSAEGRMTAQHNDRRIVSGRNTDMEAKRLEIMIREYEKKQKELEEDNK